MCRHPLHHLPVSLSGPPFLGSLSKFQRPLPEPLPQALLSGGLRAKMLARMVGERWQAGMTSESRRQTGVGTTH